MQLDQVWIVMVRPRGPDNIGMAARAIANHGLAGLALVAPACFDPDEARWKAPGAHDIIDQARVVATVEEAVAEASLVVAATARRRRWDWPVWSPATMAQELLSAPGSAAVLFGPEDAGLANEDLVRAHALLTLPTSRHSSLNLAQAITVTAHALRSRQAQQQADPLPARRRPHTGLLADLSDNALEVLRASSYLAGRSEEQVRGTLFRLLSRLELSHDEAAMVNGMLSQVRWSLEHSQRALVDRQGDVD